MSVDDVTAGINTGQAVEQRIASLYAEKRPATMNDLIADVEHIDATKAQWRVAALYLAAQLYGARYVSDAARARENALLVNRIEDALQDHRRRVPR